MNKKIMTISIMLALGTTSVYAQNLEIQENKEQEKISICHFTHPLFDLQKSK